MTPHRKPRLGVTAVQKVNSEVVLSRLKPLNNPFLALSVPNFNGNVDGSPRNMGHAEIGWMIMFWRGARLDRWIPAPTLVRPPASSPLVVVAGVYPGDWLVTHCFRRRLCTLTGSRVSVVYCLRAVDADVVHVLLDVHCHTRTGALAVQGVLSSHLRLARGNGEWCVRGCPTATCVCFRCTLGCSSARLGWPILTFEFVTDCVCPPPLSL